MRTYLKERITYLIVGKLILDAFNMFSEMRLTASSYLFFGVGNPTAPIGLQTSCLIGFLPQKPKNEKYTKHMRSSAGIAIFVADTNSKSGWVGAGRAYQRFALQAAALGIRTAF
jgi:hypothetical protein